MISVRSLFTLEPWIEASLTTHERLSPRIRQLALILASLHLFFWVVNQLSSESESTFLRIVALLAALVLSIDAKKLNVSAANFVKHLTIPCILLSGPLFLLAGLLLELKQVEPDPLVIVRRQYELIAAVVMALMLVSEILIAMLAILFSSLVILGLSVVLFSIDLQIIGQFWTIFWSSYLLMLFYVAVVAIRRKQELQFRELTLSTAGTSITHELRTPLLSIRARAQALLRTSSGEQEQNARAILEEVDSANTLIDMFLVKANPTSSQTLETTFNVSQAVEEAVSRYPYKSTKQKDCINSYLQYDMSLHGPYELFLHVLFNLLKNAFEHLDLTEGQIEIRTELDNNFRLILKDNGRGVDESDLDDVFTPFFSTSANYGAGVGLAFCRSTIEDQFGGAITLSSEQGVHTTVVIELPASTS